MNRRKFLGMIAVASSASAASTAFALEGVSARIENEAVARAPQVFASESMPSPSVKGDIWIDTANGLKVYGWDGFAWGTPTSSNALIMAEVIGS